MPESDSHSSVQTPGAPHPKAADGWAEKGIGANWQHRFFYRLLRYGGKTRAYHIAHIVTFWYVLFYPSIRRRCRFYLDRRFPNRRGFFQRFFDTYRLVRTYGSTLVDGLVMNVLGPAAFVVISPDHDRLRQLSAGTGGMVVIHAHIGCWNVGMTTLREFGKKVSVVRIPEPERQSEPERQFTTTIDSRLGLQGVIQMTNVLLEGEIVALAGDRTLGGEQTTVAAQFLGDTVMFPVTPYRLASATGSPVLVMTAPKIGRNRYELRLAKVIEVPPGLGRKPESYTAYAQIFADAIEEFVRDYPWQFYNFYDLWQNPRTEG